MNSEAQCPCEQECREAMRQCLRYDSFSTCGECLSKCLAIAKSLQGWQAQRLRHMKIHYETQEDLDRHTTCLKTCKDTLFACIRSGNRGEQCDLTYHDCADDCANFAQNVGSWRWRSGGHRPLIHLRPRDHAPSSRLPERPGGTAIPDRTWPSEWHDG